MTAPIDFLISGPLIMKTAVSMDLVNILLKNGKESAKSNLKNDWSLGDIKKEFKYKDLESWFTPLIQPQISDYLSSAIEKQGAEINPNGTKLPTSFTWSIDDLWINYQEKNEYNLPHIHNSSLSFVIWLQIPEKLKKESLLPSGATPGSFVVRYGEFQPFSKNLNSFLPEVADMIIFPSYCEHYVQHFKSDITRISAAGNVSIQLGYDEEINKEK